MYYSKETNKNKTEQSIQEFVDLDETELGEYIGNTWVNSDLLDPPLSSGLANTSELFPSFGTNRHLQMFVEAITQDLRSIDWEQIQPIKDNLTPGKCRALQDLKDLPECIIKPSDKGGNVVLWHERDYLEEVIRHLNDLVCYEKWPVYSQNWSGRSITIQSI